MKPWDILSTVNAAVAAASSAAGQAYIEGSRLAEKHQLQPQAAAVASSISGAYTEAIHLAAGRKLPAPASLALTEATAFLSTNPHLLSAAAQLFTTTTSATHAATAFFDAHPPVLDFIIAAKASGEAVLSHPATAALLKWAEEHPVEAAAIVVPIVIWLVPSAVTSPILAPLGFAGKGGVVKGGWAASVQGAAVKKGSWFALAQSTAAGNGVTSAVRTAAGVVAALNVQRSVSRAREREAAREREGKKAGEEEGKL